MTDGYARCSELGTDAASLQPSQQPTRRVERALDELVPRLDEEATRRGSTRGLWGMGPRLVAAAGPVDDAIDTYLSARTYRERAALGARVEDALWALASVGLPEVDGSTLSVVDRVDQDEIGDLEPATLVAAALIVLPDPDAYDGIRDQLLEMSGIRDQLLEMSVLLRDRAVSCVQDALTSRAEAAESLGVSLADLAEAYAIRSWAPLARRVSSDLSGMPEVSDPQFLNVVAALTVIVEVASDDHVNLPELELYTPLARVAWEIHRLTVEAVLQRVEELEEEAADELEEEREAIFGGGLPQAYLDQRNIRRVHPGTGPEVDALIVATRAAVDAGVAHLSSDLMIAVGLCPVCVIDLGCRAHAKESLRANADANRMRRSARRNKRKAAKAARRRGRAS